MPKNLSPGVVMLMMLMLVALGCDESLDERYRQLAQQSLRQQSEQNNRLAEQSQQIAEASKHLVENDSQARKEMIAAHATLQKDLQTERASVDRQREDIEQERRNIATQRHRDPIIAQAIGALGLTLACLLPLLLAAYGSYSRNRSSDDSDALSEMLVMEITADKPKLLPAAPRSVTAIQHKQSPRKSSDESDRADGE